jgi:hypothetical protein
MKRFLLFVFLTAIQVTGLFGQIVLTSSKNTPQAEFRYIFDAVIFNYSDGIHGGNDTLWDFSGLIRLNDTSSRYYTRNQNYISFYDYVYGEIPDTLDPTYLRSDGAIYRITDTAFSMDYFVIEPPYGQGRIVVNDFTPILRFPMTLNTMVDTFGYDGGDFIHEYWKKGDAWGKLILHDTVYEDVLRISGYDHYYRQIGSHSGEGSIVITYDWYANLSEEPILTLIFRTDYSYYYGPPTYTYDTCAVIYTGKVYQPCTLSIQTNNENKICSVYPNPSSGKFKISAGIPLEELEILDLQGKPLFKKNFVSGWKRTSSFEIDLGYLNDGIYFLRMKLSNGKVEFQKILLY